MGTKRNCSMSLDFPCPPQMVNKSSQKKMAMTMMVTKIRIVPWLGQQPQLLSSRKNHELYAHLDNLGAVATGQPFPSRQLYDCGWHLNHQNHHATMSPQAGGRYQVPTQRRVVFLAVDSSPTPLMEESNALKALTPKWRIGLDSTRDSVMRIGYGNERPSAWLGP